MKRLLRFIFRTFLVLLGLSLAAYIGLIHPNDARMDLPELAKKPLDVFYTRASSCLLGGMQQIEDLSSEDFAKARKALFAALPDYALPASLRFVSPYQIYVPVGSYPLKLDAQDGLFIPNGATLTIAPGLSGDYSLRFSVVAPRSGAKFSVYWAGQEEAVSLDLAAPEHPDFDANNQMYRNFWRFIDVDARKYLEKWSDVSLKVQLTEGSRISFKCEAARYGCVISDPTFYLRRKEEKPNVLVILVDTLRGDAVRAGNAPRMAALADTSVEFTRALAPGNMTSPSTNALLSCRRPSELGELAFAYGVTSAYRDDYYKARRPSFPARFLAQGYDTAMIGNVSVISEIYGVGINHGFSRQMSLETDGYDTPAIARDAIQWLEGHGDHPFFLYLHFNGPHAPYRAPLRDIFATFPGTRIFESYANTLKWLYQGEVAYTDRYVSLVLSALDRLGLTENTWIVLTADHGDQHTQHTFLGNTTGLDFSGAYFDHGATLLNDEIHVPLVIHKKGIEPRKVSDYVSTLDLGPTMLELTGVDAAAAGCSGHSLSAYVTGTSQAPMSQAVLGSEGFHGRAIVFANRYKYIRTYEPTDKRIYGDRTWSSINTLYMAPEALFDLETDPVEEHDLHAEQPLLLAQARDHYRRLFAIKDSYELIVDTPTKPVTVRIQGKVDVRFEQGHGKISQEGDEVRVVGSGTERLLLEIRGDLQGIPTVTMGGVELPLARTTMRLPLGLDAATLPAEMGGRYTLLAETRSPVAYLRRVEDDGQKNRRIQTGNPAFEKVLREWGYLNDK